MSRDLRKFGKVLRSYVGEGMFLVDKDVSINCSFEFVQLSDGRILGTGFTKTSEGIKILGSEGFAEYELIGKLFDGRELNAKTHIVGQNFGTEKEGYEVRFSGNELWISDSKVKKAPDEIRFALTNLEFSGCEVSKYPDGQYNADKTSFSLNSTTFVLKQVSDYKEIINELRATNGVDVTSYVGIIIDNAYDTPRLCDVIQDLCLLLSLAEGTYVNWLYYDEYFKGKVIKTYHRDAYVNRFHFSEPLLNLRTRPEDLKHFLQECYPNFAKNKERLGLRLAIEYYVESKSLVLMESKYLTAFLALEVLNSRYIKERTIISKETFRKLKDKIGDIVDSFSFKEKQKNNLKEKIPELNRISLRKCIQQMFQQLSIHVPDNEVGRLIQLRNKIVHKGIFGEENISHYPDYRKLINLLDKSLLKIMGYDGYFLDCLDSFKRVKL